MGNTLPPGNYDAAIEAVKLDVDKNGETSFSLLLRVNNDGAFHYITEVIK